MGHCFILMFVMMSVWSAMHLLKKRNPTQVRHENLLKTTNTVLNHVKIYPVGDVYCFHPIVLYFVYMVNMRINMHEWS